MTKTSNQTQVCFQRAADGVNAAHMVWRMDFRGRLERAQDASVGADGSPTVISRVRIHFQQYGTEWVHCINLGGIAEVSGFCPKRQGQRLFLFFRT
jgi:hypothetical protein